MKLTRLAVAALGAAALAAATAAPASAAPQAGRDKDYLAVIFSPSMARAFTAISASKVLAEGRAYNKCLKAGKTDKQYRRDCTHGVWVRYGYAAVVTSPPYNAARGRSRYGGIATLRLSLPQLRGARMPTRCSVPTGTILTSGQHRALRTCASRSMPRLAGPGTLSDMLPIPTRHAGTVR